jgi:RNA polymerase sigma factor (sigma-70 family)
LITVKLIDECKSGNNNSLKKLFDVYSSLMFKVCLRYLKNNEEAEDILSIGFTKAFKNLKTFEYRDENQLRAWIKRIMINECLMQLRKQHNFFLVSQDEVEELVYADSALQAFESDYIFAEISSLPTGYRTVLNLYCIEGYKHQEIGQMLNINEATSRSQLNKAKKLLKERLLLNAKKDEKRRF